MVARPDAPLQNLNNTVPFACDRSDSTRGAIVERERERESFDPFLDGRTKRNSWSRTGNSKGRRV